jgi:hypothetical protein
MMPTVAQFLDSLMVKNGSVYQGLWIFPICLVSLDFDRGGEEMTTLSDGLKTGEIQVRETGAMDRVYVINKSGGRAVVLEGETLVGGAQNRIINACAVVEPHADIEMPSSCVEVRRWDCKPGHSDPIPSGKKKFEKSDFGIGSLRRLKMEAAIYSLHMEMDVRIDQKTVWEHIVRQFGFSGASTKTLDLHDLYEFWDAPLQVFSQRFTFTRSQVGLIAFLDKDTWFIDVFLNRDLLFRNFKKLVRSHAFDALIRLEREIKTPPHKMPTYEIARDVFSRIKTAQAHPFKVGTNTNLFFSTGKYNGMAAIDGDRLIHLSACSRQIP